MLESAEVNVTTNPESAVAPDAKVVPTLESAGWAKVIVCADPAVILKLLVTGDAGANVESPACVARN